MEGGKACVRDLDSHLTVFSRLLTQLYRKIAVVFFSIFSMFNEYGKVISYSKEINMVHSNVKVDTICKIYEMSGPMYLAM